MGNTLDCSLRDLARSNLKARCSLTASEPHNSSAISPKSKRLTKRDRALISSSWEDMMKRGADHPRKMIRRTWLKASEYSPEWIWDTLAGVAEHHSERMAETNPHFNMIITEVTKFLDLLIRTHHMDAGVMEDLCRELGARHVRYFVHGFQPAYWDSFSIAMVEGIENALLDDSTSTDSVEREDECWRVLYAWQKFIRIVIDHMRVSYQEVSDAAAPNDPQEET